MTKRILTTATLFAIIAIILGAFGAHKLKDLLSPEMLESYKTGVEYQMYHAFFLLFLGLYNGINDRAKNIIYILTVIGTLFFSFSIYLLATKSVTNIDISNIAFITPIGGTVLIFAWAFLLKSLLKISKG